MSKQYHADVIVIGAGPAGIGAAMEAAIAGASTIVVDGFGNAGGQYWIQPPTNFKSHDHQAIEGAAKISKLEKLGVKVFVNSEVWGILSGNRVLVCQHNDQSLELVGKVLIVCTGAHDVVYPFSGWTIPGVMTAGGGQRFAKFTGTSPGKRVVVAGNGIFLWAVAASILKAGGKIVGLLELQKNHFSAMNLLLRYPEKWFEAYRILMPVFQARIPLLPGYFVKSAMGNEKLESVCVAPLSHEGKKSSDADRIINADCLLISHDFRPITEITSLLRCAHEFNPRKGGWHCKVDPETGATSVESVYAAGEITGVSGALPGYLRGALAGLSAVQSIGYSPVNLNQKRQSILRKLKRAQKFADELGKLYQTPSELVSLLSQDTIICRCEEITWGEVLAAWADGADNIFGLKLWTRIGMGRCQGRICGDAIAALIAEKFNIDQKQLRFNQPRIPIRPVSLSRAYESLSTN